MGRKKKQYKHQIAKSKLGKWHLNEKQISKVYSHRTKKEQVAQAKRFKLSIKANRSKAFARTGLGKWQINKQIEKLSKQAEQFPVASKEYQRIAKKVNKLIEKRENARIANATPQSRPDLIEAKQHRLDKRRARLNAGLPTYYIPKTTEESYKDNGTTNTSKEAYVLNHYGQKEVNSLMEEYNIDYDTAIQELFTRAIAEGKIAALAQGEGYGYIDETTKEVISPV